MKASRINATAPTSYLRIAKAFMKALRICERYFWICKRARRTIKVLLKHIEELYEV